MEVTNGAVLERHQINTDGIEHLDLQVPILSGLQRQGDLLIIPCAQGNDAGVLVGAKGVTVVRGETTGANAHILHALDGDVFWQPSPTADQELLQGIITVPDASSATLIHTQEHNVLGIGPGSYEVKRQREFQGEWQRVTD